MSLENNAHNPINQEDHAIQSTIGLLNYFKHLPSNTEVEEWLRKHRGLKHARSKMVKGSCRAVLKRLYPTQPDIDSLRHDPTYQHFSIKQLESLAQLHCSKKKQQRGTPDYSLHPSEL
jgi:hypothetical protein